ncbi:MAG: hypothetical protein ABR953_10760 [Candidatus Acidiferrales bacterium]|jgi:hypothetical protein
MGRELLVAPAWVRPSSERQALGLRRVWPRPEAPENLPDEPERRRGERQPEERLGGWQQAQPQQALAPQPEPRALHAEALVQRASRPLEQGAQF